MLWNGHGDVVQIVNEAGTIVNSYSYDEWGNIRSKTETISNPIRYTGEYFDEESGLYYLRARYYDPVIARFITKDSYEGDISNPLSINQYSYCYNNPLIYVDPSGHYTQIDFSNWTGTAAQAAQLQALYTNYEAYNAGDIGSDTASNNYTRIMDDYEKTTNGDSTITKINNSNPDTLSLTATPTTATQENKKLANIVLPNASQSYIKSEPEKNIFEFYHKLGVGLQVKIKVFGIGFELGVGNYYEDIHTNNPKHTIEGTFNIQITNKIFIGAEGKKSKSAVTGQEIKGSGEGFIGIRVFDQKLGWGDIPNSGDVIADNEVGALTPLGGFVAGIRTNLSELFRRLFN